MSEILICKQNKEKIEQYRKSDKKIALRDSCCCNCANRYKLYCHPWNKNKGKGPLNDLFGYVCCLPLSPEEGNKMIFFDKEHNHGLCEMYKED